MKVVGIILLLIGILSLIGGLVSPSGADTSVVIFGYVLKFALIIGGIALISKTNKKDSEK
jgi:uncharacterized membrane protein HdeD (DUF308 family)